MLNLKVVDDRVIDSHANFQNHFVIYFYEDMNRRQDSRMISEMKEQLRRLQERRHELESRQVDEEELGQSIVPHLSRVMRYLMSITFWFLISNNNTN